MVRPLAVDIDGTLTRPRPDRGVDPRVFDALRAYAEEAPVVVATGKSFPYPVGLCDFIGIPVRVVAENGGVVCCETSDEDDPYGGGEYGEGVVFNGDREAAQAVVEEYEAQGYSLGWGPVDLVNRWRETEVAVSRSQPLEPLQQIAAGHGQEVVDTGYAYHVKSPDVDKDLGLETAADVLGYEPGDFLAVGDSENDAELFTIAGESYAVANADEHALAAADYVTEASYADGFLEALESAAD